MKFRTICIMIVAVAVVATACFFWTWERRNSAVNAGAINRVEANREMTTRLDRNRWVEFQLAVGADTVRMLTNAALPPNAVPESAPLDSREGWRYSVAYELLDLNRNLIASSEYHFRSQVKSVRDSETGELSNPLIFGNSALVATQTRLMQFPVNRDNRVAAILRLRMLNADPQINEVVARVTSRVERADYDAPGTWNRITRSRRSSIARYCVFDHDMLSDEERTNLLRWQWTQAAAVGETDKRFLYFVDDINDLEETEEQLPVGLYVENGWLATIPVPDETGNLRLEFQRPHSADLSDIDIDIQWTGRDRQRHFLHRLDTYNMPFESAISGGILELKTSAPVAVQAFWDPDDRANLESVLTIDATSNDATLNAETASNTDIVLNADTDSDEIDITPEPDLQRVFLVDNRAVVFPVSHVDDQPTPFRISLRRAFGDLPGTILNDTHESVNPTDLESDNSNRPSPVCDWEYLDAMSEVVGAGAFAVEPEISAYDRIWKSGTPQPVSESLHYFLEVPSGVTGIRLRSTEAPFLAVGSVRPSGLAAVTRVPEDSLAFLRSDSPYRIWFIIKPDQHLDLVRDNRSFVIRTQTRPPVVDEEIAAGNYDWFRFEPSGSWIDSQIFLPLDPDVEVREQALESTYIGIESGRDYSYVIADGTRSSTPRIFYIAPESPGSIRVSCNGRTILEKQLLSMRGELDLDNLVSESAGQIAVHCDTPLVLFVKGLEIESAPRFLKRTAASLRDGRIQFEYDKLTDEDELLTMKLYRESTETGRCRLKIDIIPLDPEYSNAPCSPAESRTIRNRQYDIREVATTPSVLVDSDRKTDAGNNCFFRLGADLPAGKYLIKAERVDGETSGFVLMYQTTPGQSPVRDVEIRRSQVSVK